MPSRILEVPLLEPDSFLTIDVGSDLPEDPTEVCQLLADEKCAPKWWLAIASAYSQKPALDSAIEVVSTGLEKSPVLETEADRAPFLTMLGWLYLQKMRKAPTVDKKDLFDKSLEYGNRGFRAYQQSPNSHNASVPAVLAQGTLVTAVGNFNDALQSYQTVLAVQPQNIYAKLGRARILYFRKNYRGALKLYQEVLRQSPKLQGTANPRIGLGLCFWQLQDRVKARYAWERVLKLSVSDDAPASSGNAETRAVAHACLGLWFLDAALHGHREEFESNYVQSMTHFQNAYLGGQTSLPALKIASYLFSKHDMLKVGKFTDKVLESSTLPELLGEALFWKGRAAHYAGDLDTALTLYTQAASADPENVASSIGKGIVEIAQDRAPEALLTFELVVQSHPRSVDALFYAGLFGALKGQGDASALKAREILEHYLVQAKHANQSIRPEVLAALSQLWEKQDPRKSYEYLKHASTLLDTMPLAFTINMGVLAFSLGQYEHAESLFESAASEISKGEEDTLKYQKTVSFNLARVQEELGKVSEARAAYEKLGTLDAKARLVLMDVPTSTELGSNIKNLLEANPQNLDVRALYAFSLRHLVMHGSKEVSKKAAELEQDFYKQTLTTVDKHDVYSLVAMGNIYLSNAQAHPKSEVAKRQRAYMRAGEFFEKALQLDRRNAYAAQGVAIALAETKRHELALPVFSRVRETLGRDSNAFVNNANCLMDVGDYVRASDMYAQAHKMKPEDSNLLVLLGRSWFARGSRAKDPNELAVAVEWAFKARDSTPKSSVLKFNAAYVQLHYADVVRRKATEQRSLAQLERALEGTKEAVEALKSFIENEDGKSLPFSNSDLEDRLDQAESVLLPQLVQAIDAQRGHERLAEEKLVEAQRKRDEGIRLQQEAKEKLQREREEREAHLAAERQKLQQQAAEWEAERAAEREQLQQSAGGDEDSKKRKKKGSRRGDMDDLIDDSEVRNYSDSDSDEENRSTKKSAPKAPSASGSDDEDEGEKVQRKQNVVDDDEDDDEEEDGEGKENSNNNNEEEKNGAGDDQDGLNDLF